MSKFIIGLLLLFCATFSIVFAQDSTRVQQSNSTDSINSNMDFGAFEFGNLSKPRIDINYGSTSPSLHEDVFNSNFKVINSFEVKLGYEYKKPYRSSENIYKFSHDNFFLANLRSISDSENINESNDVLVEAWKFGLNIGKGYGYKISNDLSIGLGTSDGLVWTKHDFVDKADNISDQKVLDYIGDSFRFGRQTEATLNISLINHIGINASYERTAVFPRHMFWYWTASEITKGVANGILSLFINEVGKASPEAMPIVNFVLKNALNYGYYELMKKNMNWPIDTEPAFMFDTFKVGVSYSF